MSTEVLTRGLPWPAPVLARAVPFAVFIGLMAAEPWLAAQLAEVIEPHWLYGLRAALVAGLLFAFWPGFTELTAARRPSAREIGLALTAGLMVLGIWLLLDSGIFVLGESGSGFVPDAADGGIDWPLALMRLAGSALVVPLMEELFWRSLVMRWLEEADFSAVDPARIGLRAVLVSSLVFGLEHSQWAAGMLAGLVYGWLYMRSGNLWVAIVAHAVTNAGLGIWVLATGAWYFW
ncbi:MAG: CAAX prenyl protease-related protein [Gammaproteobacteria bacterium]|nr:CAAX prenyl protease-related protein [Gammaproteobacteria bacterium]MBU2436013.1 CAAX prenyl protease-related protein [Gammaproteobacteria bacterium]MBU2449205.1 CAAX prenyl protease-related protein [Gammaproteobacteria bacterium]